jgi:streptogramin lyase
MTPLLRVLPLLTLLVARPAAAEWQIAHLAGTGVAGFSGDGGPAVAAQINDPFGVVRGPDGAIWFCEYGGQRIRRIDRDGTIRTVAGTGAIGYRGDGGPALEATFNRPHELRFDAEGHCYIADMANHVIRRIDAQTGRISTFAGTGRRGYSGDGGPAAQAELASPHSLQFGPEGRLYICDIGNHVIRQVDPRSGVITTFAGTGKPGVTPDGAPIRGTPLRGPRSLDFDRAGNLWLATREGNQVFRFDLRSGTIHHVAGTGAKGFTGNGGPAREATLSGPKGIAVDAEGHVWLADTESHSIRRIDARTGRLELIAGTGEPGNGGEGDPLRCALARPHGVFIDADGAVFIGDSSAHRVRVLRPVRR